MKKLILGLIGISMLTACGEGQNKAEEQDTPVIKAMPVEMVPTGGSPEFADAKLTIASVTPTADGDKVKVNFAFGVENYELMSQTADVADKVCANSDKGQHIHFILDNQPYAALYEPTHEVVLEKNTEHYLLAFLSRSYHESVKSKGASLVYHFKVDENGKIQKLDDPTEPMVFYSRPKGNYVGAKETDNLLFDFFLWNTEISKDGNHVTAQIKGNEVDTTMVVTDWKAYFLKNMPIGKCSITLTLTDKDGNAIQSPMSTVTREFTLAAEEPLPAQ